MCQYTGALSAPIQYILYVDFSVRQYPASKHEEMISGVECGEDPYRAAERCRPMATATGPLSGWSSPAKSPRMVMNALGLAVRKICALNFEMKTPGRTG